MPKAYLTRSELAYELSVEPEQIDEIIQEGGIPGPALRKRKEPLWSWLAVDTWIQALPLWGTVYVVGFGPYVKIGFTMNPIKFRLAALQTGAPEKLVVFGEIEAPPKREKEMHARFAEFRLQGEWFRREGALADWISEGCPQ